MYILMSEFLILNGIYPKILKVSEYFQFKSIAQVWVSSLTSYIVKFKRSTSTPPFSRQSHRGLCL